MNFFFASDNSPAAATQRVDDEYWKEVQKMCFECIPVTIGGKTRKISRADAHFETLKKEAFQGNANAIRELDFFREHLRKKNALAPRADPAQSEVSQRIEEADRRRELLAPYLSIAYLAVVNELGRAYRERHGHAPAFRFSVPDYIDPGPAVNVMRQIRRKMERERSGEKVGYKSPPVRTQFKKGECGRNRSKPKPAVDPWEPIRAGMTEPVTVLRGGRRTKLSTPSVQTARVFERAIKGNQGARREVRKILLELDGRGMMQRPVQCLSDDKLSPESRL